LGETAAGKGNHRNGYSKKTVLTETSKIDVRIPRDREGTFDPKLIARYQRRFPGFDAKIVSGRDSGWQGEPPVILNSSRFLPAIDSRRTRSSPWSMA
jgi:hypothetical protein